MYIEIFTLQLETLRKTNLRGGAKTNVRPLQSSDGTEVQYVVNDKAT